MMHVYAICMCFLLCLCRCVYNLVEAHCYGIGRTGKIVEQSRSSEKQIEM